MLCLFITVLLATLAGNFALQGQQLYFCNEVSTDGQPIAESNKWVIDDDGGAVYLLYKHFSFIESKRLQFRIRKYTEGGEYLPYDQRVIPANPALDYLVLDYLFTQPGKYEVAVGEGNAEYVSKRLDIVQRLPGELDTYYYQASGIIACERVEAGAAINPSNEFEMVMREASVCFQVTNAGKPIEADKFLVDIFRKGPSGKTYDYLVETVSFDIEKRWNKPYFKYSFTYTGDYRLNVFTEKDVWINSSFITIK